MEPSIAGSGFGSGLAKVLKIVGGSVAAFLAFKYMPGSMGVKIGIALLVFALVYFFVGALFSGSLGSGKKGKTNDKVIIGDGSTPPATVKDLKAAKRFIKRMYGPRVINSIERAAIAALVRGEDPAMIFAELDRLAVEHKLYVQRPWYSGRRGVRKWMKRHVAALRSDIGYKVGLG